jgi:hypothetical protein
MTARASLLGSIISLALGLTVLHINTSRGERADQFEQFATVAALVDLRDAP